MAESEDLADTLPASETTPVPASPGADRYEMLERLGEGGMGVVWAARDRALDRTVALKVLHDRFLGAADQERLADEARAMARLTHRNVVAVYDVGERDGRTYLTMELVRGQHVGRWLETPRTWREVLAVFRAAGAGLAAAHAAGIVHRDVKPSNILISDDGDVRVADFGVAHASASAPPDDDEPPTATTAGMIGTPAYMSPERLRGEPADARGDQFGFCAALYEALHGKRPFTGATYAAMRDAIARGCPPPVRDVPRWLHAAIARGLAADPSARFSSMNALLAALDGPRRRAPWIAGVAVVLAGAGLAIAISRGGARGPDCSGVARELDGVWDPSVRARVNRAFEQLGLGYAPAASSALTKELDRYAGAWIGARRAVCEAGDGEGAAAATIAHQRACLDDRRRALGDLATRLLHPDAALAAHADKLMIALAPVAECADFGHLAAVSTVQGGDAERARREIAQARTAHATGAEPAAIDAATRGLDAAHRAGDRALVAEALLVRGSALSELGKYADAVDAFREAGDDAAAIGATALQLDLWIRTSLTLQWLGRLDEATAIDALADAAAPKVGDPLLRARLLEAEGILAGRRGKYEDARALFERALTAQAEAHVDGTIWAATLHNNLAISLRRLDRYDAALGEVRRAVELDRLLGDEHPAVGRAMVTEANVLNAMGRYQEALDLDVRAIAILHAAYGDDHPDIAMAESSLGKIAADANDYDASNQHYRAAIAIRERLAPDSTELAQDRASLAENLQLMGKPDEAEPMLRDVLAFYRAKLGDDHWQVAQTHRQIAGVMLSRGRVDEAMAELEQARAILERVYGAQHTSIAEVYELEANVQHRALHHARALALSQKSVAIFDALLPEDSPIRATEMAITSRYANDAGRYDLAFPLADAAAPVLRKAGSDADAAVADYEAGRAQWQLGRDRAAAIARVRDGRAVTASLAPFDSEAVPWLAEMDGWLSAHAR
ncbi:MAG TPA: serine/threonine-protein kinase [Kofleriaceae bacterium]|nr:serine/threonine-protein kinase [Kofleriaceae bacterium]